MQANDTANMIIQWSLMLGILCSGVYVLILSVLVPGIRNAWKRKWAKRLQIPDGKGIKGFGAFFFDYYSVWDSENKQQIYINPANVAYIEKKEDALRFHFDGTLMLEMKYNIENKEDKQNGPG